MRYNISRTTVNQRKALDQLQGVHVSLEGKVCYVEFSLRYFEKVDANLPTFRSLQNQKCYVINNLKVLVLSS